MRFRIQVASWLAGFALFASFTVNGGKAAENIPGEREAVPVDKAVKTVAAAVDFSGKLGKFPENWIVPKDAVKISFDAEKGVTMLAMANNDPTWMTSDNVVARKVSLPPGHYVFRALARANSMHAKLSASYGRYVAGGRFIIQVGLSPEFRLVELPFFVEGGEEEREITLAFDSVIPSAPYHVIEIEVMDISLYRLGDISPFHWISAGDIDNPHHPYQGLELLRSMSKASSKPGVRKAGRTIFQDTFTGAEIWLMSRGGGGRFLGAGHSHISPDGKYLYLAGNKRWDTGHVLRTDGSEAYPLKSLNLPWLFPWMERKLPAGSDAVDWVVESRTREGVALKNIVTGRKAELQYPTRPGWEIYILDRWMSPLPSAFSRGGVDIKSLDHETLVWLSQDRRRIALSDIDGRDFRAFEIKSISPVPEKDIFYPELSYTHGKGEDTWINVMDEEEKRYYLFELNREIDPENPFRRCAVSGIKNEPSKPRDPDTPYQVWALPLDKNDTRGLLRVNPESVPGIERKDTIFRGKRLSTEYFLWWNFATGMGSVVGERCPLLLEDGTLLHSPGRQDHGVFRSTVAARRLHVGEDGFVRGEVDYIGSYYRTDYVVWPHPFRHDDNYALVAASITPSMPLAVIDLKNRTLWTLLITNARVEREHLPEGTSWVGERYNMSSDFTKVSYISSMLCYEAVPGKGGDAYIAVMRYPQPPGDVEIAGNSITWKKPPYSREIEGFNIYRADESGGAYVKINDSPVVGLSFSLPGGSLHGYYVLTSVERSGLESRMFSNEAAAGEEGPFRHYYEAEQGVMAKPMVPVFLPQEAGNGYAAAITDPDLLYRERLQGGLEGGVSIQASVPVKGRYMIAARVRSLAAGMNGNFRVSMDGKNVGEIHVESGDWTWAALGSGPLELDEGSVELEISTSVTGIALDNVLLTNDHDFKPRGKGNTPSNPPSKPGKVEIEETSGGLTLAWEASAAPQGVRYYNIYRSVDEDFEPGRANLLGSTDREVFTDYCAENCPGSYYYRVVAVDNWNNRSKASEPFSRRRHNADRTREAPKE